MPLLYGLFYIALIIVMVSIDSNIGRSVQIWIELKIYTQASDPYVALSCCDASDRVPTNCSYLSTRISPYRYLRLILYPTPLGAEGLFALLKWHAH